MFAVIQRDDVRRQLARLSKAGLRVRIVTSRDTVENWLEAPQPTGDIPTPRVKTVLTHDKMLVAHARLPREGHRPGGDRTSNTTCGGLLYNDEVMVRVLGNRWLHDQYLAHFDDAFPTASRGAAGSCRS